MLRHSPRDRIFAGCLAALAGFVDAVGFIALGGFFVSFMSGNTTRMAVGAVAGNGQALTAALLIIGFLAGVIAASLIGHSVARRGPAILAIVAGLLAVSALSASLHAPIGVAMGFAVVAMGAINTVFERGGEVSIGVSYMTGNLVKLGQHIAAALRGGPPFGWWPFLVLWLGLVGGAILGALAFDAIGLEALWLAAGAAGIAALAMRVRRGST